MLGSSDKTVHFQIDQTRLGANDEMEWMKRFTNLQPTPREPGIDLCIDLARMKKALVQRRICCCDLKDRCIESQEVLIQFAEPEFWLRFDIDATLVCLGISVGSSA